MPQFRLGAGDDSSFRRRHQVIHESRPAPKLDPLALFGIRRIGCLGLGLAFLLLEPDRRGADLAFEVRGAFLDCVQLAAGLIRQVLGLAQFGHPAAFAALAVAKLADTTLGICHLGTP